MRLTSNASRNITGLAGGTDGRMITIMNVGSNPIVLKNDDGTSSTVANLFALTGDLVLAARQSAVLMYDATTSRWRQIANGSASAGAATAAGSDQQVQFNSAGGFGGSASMTWDGTTLQVLHSAASATNAIFGTTSSTTANATAIRGTATGVSGATYGVYGSNASTSGYGVYGVNSGTSGNSYGVYGTSASGAGFGVGGINTANGSAGVLGENDQPNGLGVEGYSSGTGAIAMLGYAAAATGAPYGVQGKVNSTGGARAVYGTSQGASGVNYGIYGDNASPTGYAGYFANSAATGTAYGIYSAVSSASGYAVYSTGGKNYFGGNTGIGTSTPATTLDVNGDITNRNVTSCAMLGTDSSGKIVCKTPAITLISTQTASASTSLQWTGLGNTYAYLRLVCSNLVNATAGALEKVQFGEGATPTWKTTAYSVSLFGQDTGINNDPYAATSYSGIPTTNTGTTGGFTSFDMTLYQTGASGIYKSVTFTAMNSLDGVSTGEMATGGGYYHGDTNPLTAIRVLPSSGNITSGQCSLYGVTQ